jgi:hypothetical protein
MRAELDGHGLVETPRNTKPFIEPASLRPWFDLGDDPLIWFAIWNPARNLAIAIDMTADEVESCEHSLSSAHRAWGADIRVRAVGGGAGSNVPLNAP